MRALRPSKFLGPARLWLRASAVAQPRHERQDGIRMARETGRKRPGDEDVPTVDLGNVPGRGLSDLDRLLRGYAAVLALAVNPPPSVAAPRWLPAHQLITRALFKARPSFARRVYLVRHVKRNLGVIERAYCRRVAAGQHGKDDEQQIQAVRLFAQSLPPGPRRWVAVATVIVTILLAQALFAAFQSFSFGQFDLKLTSIASPDASSLYDLAGKILQADADQLTMLVLALSLACYLVLRGPISGLRLGRMLLNAPRALVRRNRNSPLAAQAELWDVHAQESGLFAALGEPAPRDPPLDLLVKGALFAGPLFLMVVLGWSESFGGTQQTLDELRSFGELFGLDLVLFIVFLSLATPLAAPRLVWLTIAAFRRRQGLPLLTAIVVVALVAAISPDVSGQDVGYGTDENFDIRSAAEHSRTVEGLAAAIAPAVLSDADLEKRDLESHSVESRLRGVDLHGRSMSYMQLRAVDLEGAQLSHVNLAFSNLRESCLRNAVLRDANLAGADLRDADLRGADFRGANLRGAKLRRARYNRQTLWPATYSRRLGAIRTDHRAETRCGQEGYVGGLRAPRSTRPPEVNPP